MNSLHQPRFLRTYHGTVVYRDLATGTVRHGPWETAARNLPFEPDGNRVTLPFAGGDDFSIRRGTHQAISFERDGLFLCAEEDGELSHSRPEPSKWETFVPVPVDTLDVLATLRRTDWLIEPLEELVRGGAKPRPKGWMVDLGRFRLDLKFDPTTFTVFERAPDGGIESFSFRYGDYGTFLARRFEPLVYFCVFGADAYFRCLGLAIQSLLTLGEYDGAIAVIADRDPEDVEAFLPAASAGRVIHRRYNAASRSEMLYARYLAIESLPARSRPVLYLDADVVVDGPITPVLARLRGENLFIATEKRLYPKLAGKDAFETPKIANWFGRWLLDGHEESRGKPLAFGSSGIIGMRDVAAAAPVFRLVRELAERLEPVNPKTLAHYTDQAVLNYVLARTGTGDTGTLDEFVSYASSRRPAEKSRGGLMHFHAGVGESSWKEEAMRTYVASLSAPEPA